MARKGSQTSKRGPNAGRVPPITVAPRQEAQHEKFMRRSAVKLASLDTTLIDALPELYDAAEDQIGPRRDAGDRWAPQVEPDWMRHAPEFGGADPYWGPCDACGRRADGVRMDRFKRIGVVEQFIAGMRLQYARDLSITFGSLEDELVDFEGRFQRTNQRKWKGNVVANVAADASLPEVAAPFLIAREQGIPSSVSNSWVKRNLRLIRVEGGPRVEPIPSKHFRELERTVTQGIRRGTRPEEIAKSIRHLDGVTKRRAEVIARDQVVKQNGRMTEIRHRQIGATHYFWRTVGDGRVRQRHKDRNNVEFAYNSPPSQTPDDGPPGRPVQCRCWANANLRRALGLAA